MALLGNLVKSAIDIKHTLTKEPTSVEEAQREQLYQLLDQAKDTAFGLYHGFREMLRSEDMVGHYQSNVPIFDYHQLHDQWWHKQYQHPNITWPGKPNYLALSSGTTGKKSKRIPVTDAMLASTRSVGLSQAEHLAHFNLPPTLFEKEMLMLGSSTNLKQGRHGQLEGEISGINTSNLPAWFSGFYRPGQVIAQIDDWDERVKAIAKAAPTWDIGAIAGIPSWVLTMLQEIIKRHQLNNIHEIWPDLSIYATGGVAFQPYRKQFDQLCGRPLIYMDTYLSSEGFFAYTARPGTMDMKLAYHHGIFYEFIPFDERGFDGTGRLLADPKVLTLNQVEAGQDYALLLSTPAGAWRYLIGDTVKFTDLARLELRISGRTKYFLNVVGSQLSEEKLNDAVDELSDNNDLSIQEFAVAALKGESGEFYHQWVLGLDRVAYPSDLTNQLDQLLQERNKNYKVARQKALRSIQVTTVPVEQLYDWLQARKKKKGGQIKFPKVMKAEMMRDLLQYVEKKVVALKS